METQTATSTSTSTGSDTSSGLRAKLEDAGQVVAAATNPIALFQYVRKTIRDRPVMAALAIGGFLALFMARRRRR